MNLKFPKKKKTIKLEDLHGVSINPERDWLISLGSALFIILLGLSISLFLLLSNFGAGSVQVDPNQNSSISVNVDRLNAAVDYINSRR